MENKAAILTRQFNETIGKWIGWLRDYSFEMLCREPEPASWSLGQVYVHIIDNTKYFVEQVKECSLNNVNGEKDMHEHAKAMFRNNAFPDMLIEGPPSNLNVRQPQSKEELLQGLLLIKQDADKLMAVLNFSVPGGKTRHPGLLYFNALEWLQFADMHMRHHFRQKKRIDELLFASRQ